MKTATGFEYEVNTNALDNMELLDAFVDLQTNENDYSAVQRIILFLLGKDGKKALYDHVRVDDGRVPPAKVMAEVVEIMNALGDAGKKS